jgi:hypothetical protein
MATTINAANISIGMDIEKLKTGMDATRSEINQLRNTLKSSVPDSEKFKHQLDLIERAYKSGAISAEQYSRSVDHLQAKLKTGGSLGLAGSLKGIAGAALGGIAIGGIANQIRGAIGDVDDLADSAAKIGVTYNDLITLQKTLVEVGGITGEQAQGSIGKMVLNLAKARESGGDLEKSLNKIGLNSRSLAAMSAVDAFKAISSEFQKIGDHAEQTKFATELFGKAGVEMVPALQAAAGAVGEMEEHLRNSGMLMSDLQAQQFGHANDMMERFNDHINGMKQGFASFAVEALDAAQKLSGNRDGGGSGGSWYGNLLEEMFSNSDTKFTMSAASKALMDKQTAEQAAAIAAQADADNQVIEAVLERARAFNAIRDAEKQKAEEMLAAQDAISNLFETIQIGMAEGDREYRMKEISRLRSERERLGNGRTGENTSSIVPAIKAGTVEAYKFLNKQNDEKIARAKQQKTLEDIDANIAKLANQQQVFVSRAR